tara:strand:+ start:756 stop:1169 length:414 start_codon:yes stop_codon:yes gene_type:complete
MNKKKILIVSAKYYSDISTKMETDAIDCLKSWKDFSTDQKSFLINVPGVFEIPVVISRNIESYDGIIALGCVIKGETPHFEFISKSTTEAIMKLSIINKKPIGNGIITCLNKDQAIIRSKKKGIEAAKAVISVLTSL